jgi:hypothetical protein
MRVAPRQSAAPVPIDNDGIGGVVASRDVVGDVRRTAKRQEALQGGPAGAENGHGEKRFHGACGAGLRRPPEVAKPLGRLQLPCPQLPGEVWGLSFAPDIRHLSTANANGTAFVFRLRPPGRTAEGK